MTLQDEIKKVIREVADFPRPGILFKDITPVLYDPRLCTEIVNEMVERLGEKPDAVVGIESRGFLFGILLANRLKVPFVLVRKAGKLPHRTITTEYQLEYGTGTMEMHADALKSEWKVLIHDDLLATGGTAAAAAQLVRKAGATVSGFNFIAALGELKGKEKLINHTKNITCLVHY